MAHERVGFDAEMVASAITNILGEYNRASWGPLDIRHPSEDDPNYVWFPKDGTDYHERVHYIVRWNGVEIKRLTYNDGDIDRFVAQLIRERMIYTDNPRRRGRSNV